MARFKELNQNLEKILIQLVENQNLCKLLTVNTKTPLESPDIPDTYDLIFKNIYPMPKIPDAQENESSFLTVWFDDLNRRPNSNAFKNNTITFNILCHHNLWRLNGELRPYAILHEIDTMFNQKRISGIGKVQLESGRFLWTNDFYSGYQVQYRMYEWN